MRLLIFSDIHNDRRALERLMDTEADYYFAAGDLMTWSRGMDQVGALLEKHAGRVHVLPGNHESAQDIDRMCRRYGLANFHGQKLQIAGHWVAGLGYSNPTPFNTPGEYAEQEIEKRLEPFADLDPLVLICHCPPKDTALDRIREGLHAGSTSVRAFIDRHQPRYFFCGHIHEAEGAVATMGDTQARNVGKQGYLLEL